MKNFVKHTLAIAICAAALLSSCIKEQAYVMEEVAFDVTLTRAGATSEQQGDQIKDIMLWAFEVTSRGEVVNPNLPALGWRQYTPPTDTYTSLNLHLPVKICGTPSSRYRIIALLNRETFTDAYGNALTLGRNSTYNDIAAAMFVSSSLMSQAPAEGKAGTPGTPAVMPITHWVDVTVPNTGHGVNADGTFTCPKVTIPVYRTVAKTQFFMACKGTQTFEVNVKSLKLYCGNMPKNGAVLSSLKSTELNSQTNEPKWFTTPTMSGAEDVYDITSAANKTLTKSIDSASNDISDYDLIGSHFIYETTNKSTTGLAATTKPTDDLGYYYEIVYEADDGQEHTYYTGIPYSILRNHDYQVRALVEGGSGELTFTIEVNQWTVEETTLNYHDIATISNNGYIYWYDLPNIDDYHTWNYTSAGQVVDNPDYADDGINHKGEVNLTSAGGTTAKFKFMLDTPVGGTWIAELRPVGGMANSIVFDNGSSTMTGDINNSVNELVIKNRADNLASAGGVTNIVELHISAKGSWGGEERSYRVIGIAGEGFDPDFNYKIIQPAQ